MLRIIKILFFLCFIIQLKSQTYNVSLQGTFIDNSKSIYGNIAGYVDSLGNEYAILTAKSGLLIFNVNNPQQPILKHTLNWGPIQTPSKEVKVHKGYAYMTGDNGLLIANLTHLHRDSVKYHSWDTLINGIDLRISHTLHIDTTKNNLYLFFNNVTLGATIFDIQLNPYYPKYIGKIDDAYIFHDGYVDNDTLYAAAYNNEIIYDVTNKNNPIIISQFPVIGAYAHNCWPTPDKKFLMITNETENGPIELYNIEDLSNIEPVKTIYTKDLLGDIPHNTSITKDNFIVTAWYTDGLVIHDIKRPNNIIEVGKYEISPTLHSGMWGAWGAYAFLPSKNVCVSSTNEGLYILKPDYKRACWLEGVVKDSVTDLELDSVSIKLFDTNNTLICDTSLITNYKGEYKTGTHQAGFYRIEVSKSGYVPFNSGYFFLDNDVLKIINLKLVPLYLSSAITQTEFIQNPFHEELTINYSMLSEESSKSIRIWNALGQLIEEIKVEDTSGQVKLGKNYSEGIYFLKLFSSETIKIIKSEQ